MCRALLGEEICSPTCRNEDTDVSNSYGSARWVGNLLDTDTGGDLQRFEMHHISRVITHHLASGDLDTIRCAQFQAGVSARCMLTTALCKGSQRLCARQPHAPSAHRSQWHEFFDAEYEACMVAEASLLAGKQPIRPYETNQFELTVRGRFERIYQAPCRLHLGLRGVQVSVMLRSMHEDWRTKARAFAAQTCSSCRWACASQH
jgi:hypothetical protein